MTKNKELKPYPFSLLKVLIGIFIIVSLAAILLLSVLVNAEVKGVLGDMSELVLTSKSDLIKHRIEMYMNQPKRTNLFLSRLLLVPEHVSSSFITQELHHLMNEDGAKTDSIARVAYASASGDYIAYSHKAREKTPFLIKLPYPAAQQLNVYNGDTEASGIDKIIKPYNLLTRPWFNNARSQKKSYWSLNYQHRSENGVFVMSYLTPVRSKDGRFLGVISSDIHPSRMSEYLQSIKPFPDSVLAILTDQGDIVASTDAKYLADLSDMTSDSSGIKRAILPSVRSYPEFSGILSKTDWVHSDHTSPVSVELGKGRFYLLSRTLRDQDNLINWHLVFITPHDIPGALLAHYRMVTIMIFSGVILLALLLVIGLLVRFSRPLKVIIRKAASLGKEPWEKESHIRLFPEVANLDNELARTSVLIAESLTAQQKLAEEDPETGLPNFAGLCKQLADGKVRNMVALIHLTNFTVINMTLGKTYAMEVASNFITYLRGRLPAGALLARVRTDKFVIVFSGVMQSHQIELYEKWLGTIFLDKYSAVDAEDHVFLGNSGTVVEDITKERLLPILLNASIATHNAIAKGNGAVVRYTAEMHKEALKNFRLHEHLRGAIANDEFHLVMQPILNLSATDSCTEGECLIRWNSHELGFVPPDKFIALAEQTGLIVPIGRWIIETACRELSDFIQRGAPKHFKLHINISALQLKHPGFSTHLLSCIARHGLTPENICIELTERVLVDDSGKALAILTELRREGVTVALDDFGSGYSSLSYLHQLPFDCLKIDRDFVKDVVESKKSEAMILSVLGIAQNFHVPLVAEGIETAEMGAKLHKLGCEKAQGYFYGRPSRFEVWDVGNGEFKLNNSV